MTSTQMELGLDLGLPQDAVDVNGRVWFRDLDGNRAVFVDQDPFYCYPLDDPVLHRFCAVQLVEAGLVKVCEICRAFEIHDRAFSRYRSRFRKQGMAGLVPGKVGRKPLETAPIAAGVVQRYQSGKSTRDIANELGISPSTVQRILRDQGVQLRPSFAQQPPLPFAVGPVRCVDGVDRRSSGGIPVGRWRPLCRRVVGLDVARRYALKKRGPFMAGSKTAGTACGVCSGRWW